MLNATCSCRIFWINESQQGGCTLKPRVVLTVHGIRTRGAWQKQLAPVLAKHGLIPYPVDFDRLSTIGFLTPWTRAKKLVWFREEYMRIVTQEHVVRPSIIAHSFGTFLTCELMRAYPNDIRFNGIIFAGSIVTADFDWRNIAQHEQALAVLNEVGTHDLWPRFAGWCVPRAGQSGRTGFTSRSEILMQNESPVGHSGTFFDARYSAWSEILREPRLSKHDRTKLCDLLDLCISYVARQFNMSRDRVRANVFIPVGEFLQIPLGAHCNMEWDRHKAPDAREISTKMRIGWGSAGRAYKMRRPHIARSAAGDWRNNALSAEESKKTHSELKWIISCPLVDAEDGRVFGVLNVDGLDLPPQFATWTEDEIPTVLYNDLYTLVTVTAACLCDLEQGGI
jgi:hypothetical protein